MKTIQQDNSNFEEKLALRRHVIGSVDFPELRVLETCAGKGLIWSRLRKEYKVVSYTPCDRKPRMPGCIKMEMSDRTLNAFDISRFNVVDIDPFGDCWLAWENISKRITKPTCVFLTHGAVQIMGSNISRALRTANAIPLEWDIPKSKELAFHLGQRLLRKSCAKLDLQFGVVANHVNVSYYGFLAVPRAV